MPTENLSTPARPDKPEVHDFTRTQLIFGIILVPLVSIAFIAGLVAFVLWLTK